MIKQDKNQLTRKEIRQTSFYKKLWNLTQDEVFTDSKYLARQFVEKLCFNIPNTVDFKIKLYDDCVAIQKDETESDSKRTKAEEDGISLAYEIDMLEENIIPTLKTVYFDITGYEFQVRKAQPVKPFSLDGKVFRQFKTVVSK